MLMFGMGLSLTMDDFMKVLKAPKGMIAGLFCQMVMLPLIAFLIAYFSNLSAELKVGLVLIAACPGGATSNLITYLLRGNVALSISMTTVNSFLTMITTPLLIFLGLALFMSEGQTVTLPLGATILKIFYLTLLPTFLGIYIRFKRPGFAAGLEKPLRFILPLLYGLIYLIAIMSGESEYKASSYELYFMVAPWVLLLNFLGMLLGYRTARALKLDLKNQVTLSVEIGIQNSAMAITIASSAFFLGNYIMAIPAMVYGFFTFVSALVFGYAIKKFHRADP